MWALNMFGIACAFPCAGVLTAWHSMEAVLCLGIACQTALALTLCVVMSVESFLQRGLPCGGDGAEGAAEGGRKDQDTMKKSWPRQGLGGVGLGEVPGDVLRGELGGELGGALREELGEESVEELAVLEGSSLGGVVA